MRGKVLLRHSAAVLLIAACAAAQAGEGAVLATGLSLREAALAAARQGSATGLALPETANGSIGGSGVATDSLSRTLKLGNTEVSLDFCSGAHLLMTSNPDSIIELIEHP